MNLIYRAQFVKLLGYLSVAFFAAVFISGCGVEKKESDYQSHLDVAQSYFDSGQFRAAMIEARNALQKAPQNINAQLMLAKTFNQIGSYGQTVTLLEAVEDNKQTEYLITLSKAYLFRAKFRSAIELLEPNLSLFEGEKLLDAINILADCQVGIQQYVQAEKLYLKILQSNPSHAKARIGLAIVYKAQKRIDKYNEIIGDITDNPEKGIDEKVFLARIYTGDGEFEKAEALLSEVLPALPATDIMTPERVNVLTLMAEVLTRQGRMVEAQRYSQIVAEEFPSNDELRQKYQDAAKLFEDKDYAAAQKLLLEILQEAPQLEDANVLLGMTYLLQGDTKKADEIFESNIDFERVNDKVKQVVSMNSLKLNKPEAVYKQLNRFVDTIENDRLQSIYSLSAFALGKKVEAIAAINKAIEIAPQNERYYLIHARILAGNNFDDPEAAVNAMKKGLSILPANLVLSKSLVQFYLDLGRNAEAEKFVGELKKQHPKSVNSHLIDGFFHLRINDNNAALKGFRQAAKIDSKHVDAITGIALSYLRTGQWVEAEKYYLTLIELIPAVEAVYIQYLYVKDKLGKKAEAEKFLLTLLEKDGINLNLFKVLARVGVADKNAPTIELLLERLKKYIEPDSSVIDNKINIGVYQGASIGLADIYYQNGNMNQARSTITRALDYGDSPRLQVILFRVEVEMKNFDAAKKIAEGMIEKDNAVAQMLFGELAHRQGDKTLALDHYRDSWQLRKTDVIAGRIHQYLKENDGDEARDFEQEWLRALPNSIAALMHASISLITQANYVEAIELLEKLLKISPEDVTALNNIAWSYNELGDKKALEFAKKAASLAPENPDVLDTYGWILYKQGNIEEAIKVLESAVKLSPNNSVIKAHLEEVKQRR